MVGLTYSKSTYETEARRSQVWRQFELHIQFQASLDYKMRLCPPKIKNKIASIARCSSV